MIINLADLAWWQWLVGAIGVLGISPAPWILGLALGRLQFTRTAEANYNERATDLISANDRLLGMQSEHYAALLLEKEGRYAEMKESRDGYRDATHEERSRADKATDGLIEIAELVKTTNALLSAFDETAAKGPRP